MKVWVISKGTYSAYRVVGVLSNYDRAKEVTVNPPEKDGYYDYNEPEEFELDAFRTDAEMQADGFRLWTVEFDKDGNVIGTKNEDYTENTTMDVYDEPNRGISICDFAAKSKEDAIKIAAEHRVRCLAEESWDDG